MKQYNKARLNYNQGQGNNYVIYWDLMLLCIFGIV